LRARSGRTGITVNCVSPGGIETEADGAREPAPRLSRAGVDDPQFFEDMARAASGRRPAWQARPSDRVPPRSLSLARRKPRSSPASISRQRRAVAML